MTLDRRSQILSSPSLLDEEDERVVNKVDKRTKGSEEGRHTIYREMTRKGVVKEKDGKERTRSLSLGARRCYYAMSR